MRARCVVPGSLLVGGVGGGNRNEKEWERAQGSEKTEKGSEKIYNRESEFVAGAKKWWEKAIKTPAFPLAAPWVWLELEGAHSKNTAATATIHSTSARPNTPHKKSAHILCAMFFWPLKYNLSCSLILLPGTEFTIIPSGSLALHSAIPQVFLNTLSILIPPTLRTGWKLS